MLRKPTTHRVRPHERGFSLIELVVVVVIIGIIGAVAVPAISRANDSRAVYAAAHIARDLTSSRNEATTTGLTTWTTFSLQDNSYSKFNEVRTAPGRAGRTASIDPATGRVHKQFLNITEFGFVTLQSVNFNGGTELGFDWLGRPIGATEAFLTSSGTISLRNGRSVTVQVNSGLVSTQ